MGKKALIITTGAVIVALGLVASPLLFCKSKTADKLNAYIKGTETFTEKEVELLDMDGNGKIDRMDWVKAKYASMFGGDNASVQVYAPVETYVKLLGRTYYHEESKTTWCSLSGTGIAFTFTGKQCALTLVGDTQHTGGETNAARYAIYLNDALVTEAQLTTPVLEIEVLNSDTVQQAEVRVVKLSEAANSSFGIRDIVVDAEEPIVPIAAKAHTIEFIGDSITCGYGVDLEETGGGFKTLTENVTRTYAYQTALALDADYSMVSYSGHGILSGYTGNGQCNTSALVPPLYDKFGFSYGRLESGEQPQDIAWAFETEPSLIVINLGTNDASYTGTDSTKMKEYAAAYVAFLKDVRAKNPNAPILCTLGIMGTTLCEAMELAVSDYTAETGDMNINSMRFEVQSAEDGYAVDWHPTAATHNKAAEKLTGFIREWLGW